MTFSKMFKLVLMFNMILSLSLLFALPEISKTDDSVTDVKNTLTLEIVAQIEYGSDPVNFIFNRTSLTAFTMLPFTFNSATHTYDHTTYAAAAALEITFPATGNYQLEAKHYGSTTATTFTQASVNGTITVPLTPAGGAAGVNVDVDTNNNVLTIVVNPGAKLPETYTLRFRRRAYNAPAAGAITAISEASPFTCLVSGSNTTAAGFNGDNLSSLQEIIWSVNSITGTGYFATDSNVLTTLSNGDVTVTATLKNNLNISATTSSSIPLSNGANWLPHLGKLELQGKEASDKINIFPLFSSDPAATGVYSGSIVGDYSTLKLNLMAPSDCQVFINDARVSSNGESRLRIGPTNPIDSPTAITYTIRVEKSPTSFKTYVLNVQREIEPRLRYGGTDSNGQHLASEDGDIFGLNSATENKLTVQAWVRWTSDPTTGNSWANIASQTTDKNGSSGSFMLQHNNQNSSFEFAVRTTSNRVYVVSDLSKVTIERGVWYLLTGVYNGANLKIFVNNENVTASNRNLTGGFNADESTSEFNVGKMPYGGRNFNGNIRNLRIWVGSDRTASMIASDYSNTPLAGSTGDDSSFSWPLNETSNVGNAVATGNGGVSLSMVNVAAEHFVSCCTNNTASGQALIHRPERMDLSSADSESVILVQAQGYSGSDLRFRILGPVGDTTKEMQAWDHVTSTWISSGTISTGVLMNSDLGNPATGTYFWVPVRVNTSDTGGGRYVDDDTESSYNGTDANIGARIEYNTIMPLPSVIGIPAAAKNTFTLTGTLKETTSHPLSKKYVILGYDAVEKGKLITGTSSAVTTGSYNLVSNVPLHRIEVRTQSDVLITELTNNSETGWTITEDLGDTTLPVVLSSFTAINSLSNGVMIQWVSQSEDELDGYRIYRNSAESLEEALMLDAFFVGTNTTQTQTYTFFDKDELSNGVYYYWLEMINYDGTNSFYGPAPVEINNEFNDSVEIPLVNGIASIYPNPFNPVTTIRYSLINDAKTVIELYNLRGQRVKLIDLGYQVKGFHNAVWDGTDQNGNNVASGIYFTKITIGKTVDMKKIVLMK